MGSHQLLARAEKWESSSAETEEWVRVWWVAIEVGDEVRWERGRDGRRRRRCAIVNELVVLLEIEIGVGVSQGSLVLGGD